MLAKFLVVLIIALILFIALVIIKIGVPIWRFMTRAESVITLYDNFFGFLLKKQFVGKEGHTITISYGQYTIEFSSSKEASTKFEELINDALECYDELGTIAMLDSYFKIKKDRLIDICSKVRTMRWYNPDF